MERVAEGPALAGLRVMVVEDSALVAMHLEEILTDSGCVVVGLSGSLEEAKDVASSTAVDVALLDINIRGEMVFPLARELKELRISIVFSSGYATPVLPAEFSDAVYLSKPFEPEELVAAGGTPYGRPPCGLRGLH